MNDAPPIEYARSGDVHIAYQSVGEGERDLLFLQGSVIPMESMWEQPRLVHYLRRLGAMGRLLVFDRRGIGMSDPISPDDPPTLEQWTEDALAVMDAAGSRSASIVAYDVGGMVSCFLAATFPERVDAIVLTNCYSGVRDPAAMDSFLARLEREWGRPAFNVDRLAPSVAEDERFATWVGHAYSRGARPGTARALFEVAIRSDIRPILRTISTPTLVVHREGNLLYPVAEGRRLAESIPDAKLVLLPGADHLPYVGDADEILDEIEDFLTGRRSAPEAERVLTSMLFTDIVGSTDEIARVGDRRWRQLLDAHDEWSKREVVTFGGRIVNTTGDGILATFDGPARAIRCARAISEALGALGVEVRAGVHTGEVERRGDDLAGIGVSIAARVSSLAGPGEVLVSGTVPPLVAGSGIEFADRGSYELKGVPGTWQLFEVVT